jgi:hypothetical protein
VEFAALHLALSQLSDEQREAVLLVGAEGLIRTPAEGVGRDSRRLGLRID